MTWYSSFGHPTPATRRSGSGGTCFTFSLKSQLYSGALDSQQIPLDSSCHSSLRVQTSPLHRKYTGRYTKLAKTSSLRYPSELDTLTLAASVQLYARSVAGRLHQVAGRPVTRLPNIHPQYRLIKV